MCIAPITLDTGIQTSCHKCWQCKERAINDWVGRCIAEIKTAKAASVVTLTYGRSRLGDVDHERATILTYSDFQKYLKLLRFHGFPVRYLVAGEYGSQKGRAHWHAVLFWQDAVPTHSLLCNFMQDHWPHGWSFWDRPNAHAIRYICKYILKDAAAGALKQGMFAMSKKPPLGAAYFRWLAEQYVNSGLAPQDCFYTFPDVRRGPPGAQKIVEFMLADTSAALFLEHYCSSWEKAHPGIDHPPSELVDAWEQMGRTNGWPIQAEFDRGDVLGPGLRAVIGKARADAERKARDLERQNYFVEWMKHLNTEDIEIGEEEHEGYYLFQRQDGRTEWVRRGSDEQERLKNLRKDT